MNTNVNILFYSRHCKTCENLMKILQNENLLQFFRLICVDNQLDTLPSFIKKVPTLLVSTSKQPLVDNGIYEWIKTMKYLRQSKVEENKNIAEYNINKTQNQNTQGPRAYLNQEMDGFSDTFAYTKCDNAIPHRFFEYDENNKEQIFTAPEQKINDDILNKRLKECSIQRQEQDEQITGLFHQQIQNIISTKIGKI